jgi:hypothetical protein
MLINACRPFAWRDQFARTNMFNVEDRKRLRSKWGDLLANLGAQRSSPIE